MVWVSAMLTASGWVTPATQSRSTHCKASSWGEGHMFQLIRRTHCHTEYNENSGYNWKLDPFTWGHLTRAGRAGAQSTRLWVTSLRYFTLPYHHKDRIHIWNTSQADNILSHLRKLIHEASSSSSNVSLIENSTVTNIDRWWSEIWNIKKLVTLVLRKDAYRQGRLWFSGNFGLFCFATTSLAYRCINLYT